LKKHLSGWKPRGIWREKKHSRKKRQEIRGKEKSLHIGGRVASVAIVSKSPAATSVGESDWRNGAGGSTDVIKRDWGTGW